MDESISALSYAVRYRVVARYLGQLLLVYALLCIVPLGVSLYFAEIHTAWRYAGMIALMCLFAAPSLYISTPRQIHVNEAMVVTATVFVLAAAFMVYPMMDEHIRVVDALFEAVSGITTTGLTTLANVENKSHSFLFARAWLQWCGGLGIVVLSVALFADRHASARRLLESTGGEMLDTTARTYARRMLAIYLVLTGGGFLLLWSSLGDAFVALTHTLAAVSTGGFSTYDSSLGEFQIQGGRLIVTTLGLLGALPLSIYYLLFRRQWHEVVRDLELRSIVVASLVLVALLYLSLRLPGNIEDSLGHAFMMGVSAQTTTGFSSLDIGLTGDLTKLLLIVGMFIGGGIGSTAGGIKMMRLLVSLRMVQYIIRRSAIPPHAVTSPRLGGRLLTDDDLERVGVVVILFFLTIVLSWFPFIYYGYPPLDALFEVVSAVGTVGLSSDIARPELETELKLLLCLDMLAGRLEIVALLVLCYPGTWFGRRAEN